MSAAEDDDFFGDFDDDDAFDTEPPDPFQVTLRVHKLRNDFNELFGGSAVAWDDLDEAEQELALAIGTSIVEWVLEHQIYDPEELAQRLHDVMRFFNSGRDPWEDLTDEERQVGIELMTRITTWLQRQGGIP